jgi:hypothetical protein
MVRLTELSPTGFRDSGSEYIKGFVTFLDILGFKDHVKRKPAQEINRYLDAMLGFSQLPQRRSAAYASPELAPMVVQFSDSIVRIQPVPEKEDCRPYDLLIGEINALLLMQGNLACHGVLVRGGLTFGDVCVRDSRVFGPAFIRAYEIESTFARYPRILVDQFLCSLHSANPLAAKADRTTLSAVREELAELLERNEDGQFAIQYLTHLVESERSEDISCLDVLRAHRDAIEGLLAEVDRAKSEEPHAKIFWVARYHNRCIERGFNHLDQEEHERTGRGLCVDAAL